VLSYDAEATYMQFDSQSAVNERTQKGVLDTRTGYVKSASDHLFQIARTRTIQSWAIRECDLYGQ